MALDVSRDADVRNCVPSANMGKIPVNIITGSLGVGKTTAIRALLERRPQGEKWAVLVNEFGALGIDGALISSAGSDDGGITVREVAGGCMCCANGLPLTVTIAQVSPKNGLGRHPGGHPTGGAYAQRAGVACDNLPCRREGARVRPRSVRQRG
eukprot:2170113-Pyramimonas_sp.AAC.1